MIWYHRQSDFTCRDDAKIPEASFQFQHERPERLNRNIKVGIFVI